MYDTTMQAGFQTAIARDHVQAYTGSDDPYRALVNKGRGWLKMAGIKGIVGNDIPFLVYRLWNEASAAYQQYGEIEGTVPGDLVDGITDEEAALLCEIEPTLQRYLGEEGVGECTPEVTAILRVLDEVAYEMEHRWNKQGESA